MKIRKVCSLIILLLLTNLLANAQTYHRDPELNWFNTKEHCIKGKRWSETRHFYDRLPARAEGVIRLSAWGLGNDSPGLFIRFVTDTTANPERY